MKRGIVCVDDEAILVACMKQDILSRYGGAFVCETALGGCEALDVIDAIDRLLEGTAAKN